MNSKMNHRCNFSTQKTTPIYQSTSTFNGTLNILKPSSTFGNRPARILICKDWCNNLGGFSILSRLLRISTNSVCVIFSPRCLFSLL